MNILRVDQVLAWIFFGLILILPSIGWSQDQIPPQPRCKVGIVVVLPISGTITLTAESFDDGSTDNVTPPELLHFFFDNDPLKRDVTINCDTFKNNELIGTFTREFQLGIMDEAGNVSQCIVSLEVQDNKFICGRPFETCTGCIRDWASKQLISADSSCAGEKSIACYSVFLDEKQELSFCKKDDVLNGISTADLIAVRAHLLGRKEFEYMFQYFAADVNLTQSVSAADISAIRKLVLGTINDFSQWGQDSYLFFLDEGQRLHPFNGPPVSNNKVLSFDTIGVCPDSTNFLAVKVGDINPKVDSVGRIKTRSGESVPIQLSSINGNDSEQNVSLRFLEPTEMLAFQMDLRYPAFEVEILSVKSGLPGFNSQNFVVDEKFGSIRISWDNETGELQSVEDELISITYRPIFNKNDDIHWQLDQSLLNAEMYDQKFNAIPLELNQSYSNNHVRLVQNPTTDIAQFEIESTTCASASISFFDGLGKQIFNSAHSILRGKTRISIPLEYDGLVLYSIQLNDNYFSGTLFIK